MCPATEACKVTRIPLGPGLAWVPATARCRAGWLQVRVSVRAVAATVLRRGGIVPPKSWMSRSALRTALRTALRNATTPACCYFVYERRIIWKKDLAARRRGECGDDNIGATKLEDNQGAESRSIKVLRTFSARPGHQYSFFH
ncbi:hypothetical protein HDV57DRAFT_174097 [Trichoderma longibrachiatum]